MAEQLKTQNKNLEVIKKPRGKAKYILPTKKMKAENQIETLRVYGTLGASGEAVTTKEISKQMEFHPAAVSNANAFFIDVGLITKQGDGYLPSKEVIAYASNYGWNSEEAGKELQPQIKNSWFGKLLLTRLKVKNSMTEDEVIAYLGSEAMASPDDRSAIKHLIEYLQVASLIQRDVNGKISASNSVSRNGFVKEESEPLVDEATSETEVADFNRSSSINNEKSKSKIIFKYELSNMDMKDWSPENITAFFKGIEAVELARKRQTDEYTENQ